MAALYTLVALLVVLVSSVSSKHMLIGYFPNWLYANYPVEQIPYTEYTHINYAFSMLNDESNLPSFPDDWAVEAYLPKIVDLAHQAGTKILLSIGGWTGSQRFSPMVASADARKAFIDWNLNFIETYQTDGVDLDWEYPGRQGAGCNEVAPNDAENFLLLLQELRQALDQRFPDNHKEVSMAVHVDPFTGPDGTPMKDVSGFASVVDHINLMTYDINGAWAEETGPNAPFQYEDGKGASYSFVESIRKWKEAGIPGEKLTAGLAFYGRSMQAQVDMTENPLSQYQAAKVGAPKGDADDAYWSNPYCAADIDGTSGVWKWRNLRSEGVILDDLKSPGEGWQRYWDDVSKTPWLFNAQNNIYISYDDPQSIQIKVDHALCEDIAGVMVWDLHQDNGELLRVANTIHNDAAPENCPSEANTVIHAFPQEQQSSAQVVASSSVASMSQQSPAVVVPIPKASSSASQVAAQNSRTFAATSGLAMPTAAASSNPAVAASSPSLVVAQEDCPVIGEQRCISSGQSAHWLTCSFNKWVQRSCSSGSVCHDDQGFLFCGFPKV
ncbi:glycosyl hydrolases family 18-domain-containing protein [Zychaea mexicana]|uniref:glycosyl hydrolases family 18-domain-containing protein n=1 Tax=Zychaea mexicana TaxID=64656 RepID=UPI0022FE8EB2|nr:glycosyl hydrolases family 18-domain-containing protein [Zychaea mexicana]KAI9488066.1 glycosyl hydrolases family 18-domain-containing protein [Zychaea mexicana]